MITHDRAKLTWIWLGSFLLIYLAAAIGSWSAISSGGIVSYVEIWSQWDTNWFESIAVHGYVGPYVSDFEDFRYNVAFFPGVPMLMKAGGYLGLSATLTGMFVSFFAVLSAAFALSRLTQGIGGKGSYAVLAWVLAPTAVFLAAAYTEALFAAFAFWAWAMAKEKRWVAAGTLAGVAALVRPNGIFLGLALLAMFLLAPNRDWKRGSALLLPFAAVGAYFYYLYSITGDWNAWSNAQAEFWKRELVDPISSFTTTYQLIFTFSPTGEPSSRFVTEIVAMAILIGVVVVTVIKRWWAEAIYVFLTTVSLGTSTNYYSIPRTLVVVFPLWMILGLWMTNKRWFRWSFVFISVPLLVLVTMRFTQGQWIS